ncbi:hypothetical protein V6Z12_D12G118100 [Gossypium hirsutum]
MKIFCWNCHGVGNPATIRELKQLLVANVSDILFLCETKVHSNEFSRIQSRCRMGGCLAVSSEGKSNGLAMMWREDVDVTIQTYSKFHIDSLIKLDNGEVIRFTSFYGHPNPNLRHHAWDMLKKVKDKVNEGWIVGGDFNAILNNSEKEGGRRKPTNMMEDFWDILDVLNLSDVKTKNGWFTWTNNREGNGVIKERLDRFLISDIIIEKMPFITSSIVRQSKSDHEAILLDLYGNNPKEKGYDLRAWFRYDVCWAKEQEAKDIISKAWSMEGCNTVDKMKLVKDKLGPWQYNRVRKLRNIIKGLEKDIHNLMDGQISESLTNLLKIARSKLGYHYEVEEKYWATRAQTQWLKEGDRNTRFFHAKASSRRSKNSIDSLKDEQGVWCVDKKEIC